MNNISMGEDIGTKINQNFSLNSNNFKLVNTTKEYGRKLIYCQFSNPCIPELLSKSLAIIC